MKTDNNTIIRVERYGIVMKFEYDLASQISNNQKELIHNFMRDIFRIGRDYTDLEDIEEKVEIMAEDFYDINIPNFKLKTIECKESLGNSKVVISNQFENFNFQDNLMSNTKKFGKNSKDLVRKTQTELGKDTEVLFNLLDIIATNNHHEMDNIMAKPIMDNYKIGASGSPLIGRSKKFMANAIIKSSDMINGASNNKDMRSATIWSAPTHNYSAQKNNNVNILNKNNKMGTNLMYDKTNIYTNSCINTHKSHIEMLTCEQRTRQQTARSA